MKLLGANFRLVKQTAYLYVKGVCCAKISQGGQK